MVNFFLGGFGFFVYWSAFFDDLLKVPSDSLWNKHDMVWGYLTLEGGVIRSQFPVHIFSVSLLLPGVFF